MSSRHLKITTALQSYIFDHSVNDDDILRALRAETAEMPLAGMQISAEQGQFMGLMIQALGARNAIEVGTFTGYSALVVARALPPRGKLIACDVNAETTAVARRYWKEAGVDQKIDLRLGPAVTTLKSLIKTGGTGKYDFFFIDADKENYDAYYELALTLVRRGGLIAIDNVLWGGKVADPRTRKPSTVALRRLNRKLHRDDRVTVSLLPIGDGLTLAIKK